MNKIYNLKQDNFKNGSSIEELDLLKSLNKKNRRKNEILNGFILLIGIVGFLTAFLLPRDFVYSRSSLENSFTNNSHQFAASSLMIKPAKKACPKIDWEKHFRVNGFPEAGESLGFEFDHFCAKSKVNYMIQFGNGDSKEMTNKITSYRYAHPGKYWVKVIANYNGEEKELHSKLIKIDQAIIVNSVAYEEAN